MDQCACLSVLSLIFPNWRQSVESVASRGASSLGNWLLGLFVIRRRAGVLTREMVDLMGMRSDFEREVSLLEVGGVEERTDRVRMWLQSADNLQTTVCEFQAASCCGCLCAAWQLDDLLTQIRELKKQKGDLGVLVCRSPPPPVEEIPSKFQTIVWSNGELDTVLKHLASPAVAVVAIHGMPGAGKTALLTSVNNKLQKAVHSDGHTGGELDFERVIFISLKQGADILHRIQKKTWERLGLPSSEGDPASPDGRASALRKALSRIKALFLLDNVCDGVDWEAIGIPSPGPKCKVVFTTPSKEWCHGMGAPKWVKVKPLDDEQSWELFRKEMKSELLEAPARRLVFEFCGGLPRAIIHIAGAVADFTISDSWKGIMDSLRNSPQLVPGMLNVLTPLKSIFDRWETRPVEVRQCLQYCILFPEGKSINIEQLTEYWYAERFLDADGHYISIHRARCRASTVIDRLRTLDFLVDGEGSDEVILHSVVRQFVTWLTNNYEGCPESSGGEHTKCFLTSGRLESYPGSAAESWEKTVRISQMEDRVKHIPKNGTLNCPHLRTVLLNNYGLHEGEDNRCRIEGDLSALFRFSPALCTLDVSGTDIDELPACIGLLTQLRYLNVSNSNISSLPVDIKHCEKLVILHLRYTHRLSSVPREAIAQLYLEVLDLFSSGYTWSWEGEPPLVGSSDSHRELQLNLKDLEEQVCTCKHPRELGLSIGTVESFEHILGSRTLFESIVHLELVDIDALTTDGLSPVFYKMSHLRHFSISGRSKLSEFRINKGDLPELELQTLSLSDLPISDILVETGTFLTELRSLHIRKCPLLKKLPLGSNLCMLKNIFGEQDWWDSLKWDEGENVKDTFVPRFKALG